jgi:hypothetical protein
MERRTTTIPAAVPTPIIADLLAANLINQELVPVSRTGKMEITLLAVHFLDSAQLRFEKTVPSRTSLEVLLQ